MNKLKLCRLLLFLKRVMFVFLLFLVPSIVFKDSWSNVFFYIIFIFILIIYGLFDYLKDKNNLNFLSEEDKRTVEEELKTAEYKNYRTFILLDDYIIGMDPYLVIIKYEDIVGVSIRNSAPKYYRRMAEYLYIDTKSQGVVKILYKLMWVIPNNNFDNIIEFLKSKNPNIEI